MPHSDRQNRWLVAAAATAVLVWLAFVGHVTFGLGGSGADHFFNAFVYSGLIGAAGVSCLLRAALRREERLAWAIMGGGILAWTAGEVYYSAVLSERDVVPIPSAADAGYLSFYLLGFVAVVLLVRARIPNIRRTLWLDGAIAALAVSALAAAVAFDPILEASVDGDTLAIITNLAYPVSDLVMLGMVVAVFGLSGWRPGAAWALLGAGLVAMAVADGLYLFQAAKGTYVEGGLLDAWWPAAALLVGFAAWAPSAKVKPLELQGLRVIVVPSACGMLAIALVAGADLSLLGRAATVLSLATLFVVTVRMALAFHDNQRMLSESRHEAHTDALTGLGNRRRMMVDLETAMQSAQAGDPALVVLFDLDGFKRYNDTYGHPAGDELLARLGGRLGATAANHGRAYRLGGDEFCVIAHPGAGGGEAVIAATSASLSDTGEGFHVTASHGSVAIPSDAATVSDALQLADRRMYAQKGKGRASAGRQTRDVLLSTLRERQPDLHAHLTGVAATAGAAARQLAMSPEEIDEVARAAELHDVGKIAIPDAILQKPGPLDDSEWSFVRRHTIIGERILAAAPALIPVARLVRSSHERWDGSGYPDRLSGEQIPLGARIVSVCDAFDAMISPRPYREPVSRSAALDELHRCAGTQFDARVVAAFEAALKRTSVGAPS